jgi:hypothetical protein
VLNPVVKQTGHAQVLDQVLPYKASNPRETPRRGVSTWEMTFGFARENIKLNPVVKQTGHAQVLNQILQYKVSNARETPRRSVSTEEMTLGCVRGAACQFN